MTKEEHEEILRIVRELKKSPAMNGAFNKLTKDVEHIKNTQGDMCSDMHVVISKQKEAQRKLDDLHKALYHPDQGIYKRIADSHTSDVSQNNLIEKLEEKQVELIVKVDEQKNKIHEVESVQEDLKKVAGDRMENLDTAVKAINNTKRLIWVGLAAVVGFVIKALLGF